MKKVVTVCALIAAVSFSVNGQTMSPAKKQDIMKLIEITNAKAQMAQTLDLMFANLTGTVGSGVQADVINAIKTKFASRINEFVNILVPIYDKHLTHEDIKQIIKFYETPTGKKMIKATPLITQESFTVGQKWGQDLAQEIVTELMQQQK